VTDDEQDKYFQNLYNPPEIIVGNEGETLPRQPVMPAYLKVEFEEAREAEDWFGIEQDLKLVVAAATRAADLAQHHYAA